MRTTKGQMIALATALVFGAVAAGPAVGFSRGGAMHSAPAPVSHSFSQPSGQTASSQQGQQKVRSESGERTYSTLAEHRNFSSGKSGQIGRTEHKPQNTKTGNKQDRIKSEAQKKRTNEMIKKVGDQKKVDPKKVAKNDQSKKKPKDVLPVDSSQWTDRITPNTKVNWTGWDQNGNRVGKVTFSDGNTMTIFEHRVKDPKGGSFYVYDHGSAYIQKPDGTTVRCSSVNMHGNPTKDATFTKITPLNPPPGPTPGPNFPGGGGIVFGFGGLDLGDTGMSEPLSSPSYEVPASDEEPSRPAQPRLASVPAASEDTCDTVKRLAEITRLMDRLTEVQRDLKAGYQDGKAVAEIAKVIVKKLEDLKSCVGPDKKVKTTIDTHYSTVQEVLAESMSETAPKPNQGG